MKEILIILLMLLLSAGMMLYFVGLVNTIIIAFGRKHTKFGLLIVLFNPLAILYCINNWNISKTQGKQLIIGLLIMCIIIIPGYFYYKKYPIT